MRCIPCSLTTIAVSAGILENDACRHAMRTRHACRRCHSGSLSGLVEQVRSVAALSPAEMDIDATDRLDASVRQLSLAFLDTAAVRAPSCIRSSEPRGRVCFTDRDSDAASV